MNFSRNASLVNDLSVSGEIIIKTENIFSLTDSENERTNKTMNIFGIDGLLRCA